MEYIPTDGLDSFTLRITEPRHWCETNSNKMHKYYVHAKANA